MQPDQDPSENKQSAGQSQFAPNNLANPDQTGARPVVTLTPDNPGALESHVDEYDPQQQEETGDELVEQDGDEMEPVHWQAHEYIHHEKGAGWFIIFTFVVAALIALAIFVIDSLTFAILIPVMAAALVVYAHRPPRVIDYTLSRQGLHVNDRLYAFSEFKAFGVIHDDGEYSVMLVPTRRFKQGVTVYFPEEAGEAIVDMLGARLPMQELHLDAIDRVIRKLRI